MRNFCKPKMLLPSRNVRRAWFALLLGVALAGCGGGGGDSPTSAPAAVDPPAPPAPPPPPPPPPPAPAPTLPPLAAAIDLNDNHAVGADHWSDRDTSDGGQGQAVGGLECMASMDETYHVHTHLSIFLNGEALAIPAELGIVPQTPTTECFYSLHTHDKSGKIHVEAAAPAVFTLGQLFAIWGQPLETTNIAGLTGMPVVVYVTDDGVVTEASGDWHTIELKSHREITIQVGTPITEIPNFTWSAH
jgi:hypothetical protein